MKKSFIMSIISLSVMMVSCDEHIIEDASWHSWVPGMVYSTNGDVSSYEKCIEKGNTPEAVIFHVEKEGETEPKAYAVTLHDVSESYFSDPDTVFVAQGTSADEGAFDGETNTTSLRYSGIKSPIALRVQSKYYIPSLAEMYQLYSMSQRINPVIEQCGGDILPVDKEYCWYWTSTENRVAPSDRAWRFSMYSGRYESENKHCPLPTRPIMIIRLHKAEQK